MKESPMGWHALGVQGTYVRKPLDVPWEGFKPRHMYDVFGLRRVVHPSVHQVIDSIAEAAEVIERGEPDQRVEESPLYATVQTLPMAIRRYLCERRPEVIIPALGLAGSVLAPLQLLGPVPCIRGYLCRISGDEATELYEPPLDSGVAPEIRMAPPSSPGEPVRVRYLDMLWERSNETWPTNPLVLIANGKSTARGYAEHSRSDLDHLVRAVDGLPSLKPDALRALPEVPDGHFHWAIGLIVRASLGAR